MSRPRKTEKYYENPFIKPMAESMRIGAKPIFIKEQGDCEQLIIVNNQNKEIVSQAGIFTRKPVDQGLFAKIYVNGIAPIVELNSAGKQIFLIIFKKIANAKAIGKTELILNYDELAKEAESRKEKMMSIATFYRGLKNCIEKNIIAESLVKDRYFINPQFIFNGNRLTVANEYYLKQDEKLIESTKKLRNKAKK